MPLGSGLCGHCDMPRAIAQGDTIKTLNFYRPHPVRQAWLTPATSRRDSGDRHAGANTARASHSTSAVSRQRRLRIRSDDGAA